MDYTPYAIKRDNEIKVFCEKNNIKCEIIEDYLLAPVGTFNKKDNTYYKVFTPFKNNILKKEKYIIKPKNNKNNFVNIQAGFECEFEDIKYIKNENILLHGGRRNALKILKNIKKFKNYNLDRNILSKNTTNLSAYIKFGCVSIREVYFYFKENLGINNSLISQLCWRDFYYYIAYYNQQVLGGMINKKNENFNNKFNHVKWNNNKKFINNWKNGKTGYEIVDSGMNQLNTVGYMHNRGRLITANFLNRLLGIDWRVGEKYFATKLIDYDPIVNNGNWQWISSTGVDTKPFKQRIFNPYLQEKKYDKEKEYINKWKINDKILKEIVNYKKVRENSIKMYTKIK